MGISHATSACTHSIPGSSHSATFFVGANAKSTHNSAEVQAPTHVTLGNTGYFGSDSAHSNVQRFLIFSKLIKALAP